MTASHTGIRTAALVVTALFFLGGCASLEERFAQIKATSTVNAPSTWSSAAEATRTITPTDDTLAVWWHQFNDPQLDALIEAALTAAPDVRTAQAKLRQSRAARELAVANLYPSLDVSASATRSRAAASAGGTGKTQTLYAAGFDASWEPSIFGGLRDAVSGAEADAAAAAAMLESTRASLAAEVALEYVTLRASQQRLEIARANVASQAETLQIATWREMAGLVTTLDVEQARTNLEQSRASIPSLENSRAAAENRLALLTGRVPGSWHTALQDVKPLPTAPDQIAVGIPADTLRRRPDLSSAEFTLRAEIARTAEREADRYPTLTLSGSLGWKAFSTAALGGSGSLARSLAVSLAANIFDAGRISSRIEAQSAVQEQALITYEKTLLTALEDVENAMVSYATGRDRIEARRRAAVAAANAAILARNQYEAGIADFQKVLETERTRLTAEDNLASAEADVLTAVIQLYKALGGGWQATPTPQ